MRPAILALVVLSGGCCWWAKRDCFPACPKPVTKVVTKQKPCKLPPRLHLDSVELGPLLIRERQSADVSIWRVAGPDEEKAAKWMALEVTEAAKLARNLGKMRTWMREVSVRCGILTTTVISPSSQPAPSNSGSTPRGSP